MSEASDGGAASPSLSMNHNSAQPELPFQLSGSQRKTARAIEINVDRMVAEAGIERVGFLTLTVGDEDDVLGFIQCWDAAEASRRINNLARRFLPSMFLRWVIITERHKSGAIHFHLIVETIDGIRGGFDWEACRRGEYASACPALRRLWEILRKDLPAHGFGRAQLEPLKNGEAASRYVAKYVEKNLFNRLVEDRRKKLVRYGGWGGKHCRSNDISWATPRAAAWRAKARTLAAMVGAGRHSVAAAFGPRWSFRLTRLMHVLNPIEEKEGGRASLNEIRFATWPEQECARMLVVSQTCGRGSWAYRNEMTDGYWSERKAA